MENERRYWLQEALKNDPFLSHREYEDIKYMPFDILNILEPKEPFYNHKGVKKSKDYFYSFIDGNGNKHDKLAVRIEYIKILEDIEFNGVTILNVWAKNQRIIHFYRTDKNDDGEYLKATKIEKPQRFNLNPVYKGDGTETLIGFSSIKQMDLLRKERYNADKYLQSKNIGLYQLIYSNYKEAYNSYLSSGEKTNLINELDNESNPDLIAVLQKEVAGTTLKIIDLIKMNLQ